jgi:hypothetical protein
MPLSNQNDSMLTLHAGNLQMLYSKGFLRYLGSGQSEVIRMFYFALRDENWGTYESVIENEKIINEENSFKIEYRCSYFKHDKKIFKWDVTIKGDKEGTIRFTIDGEALDDILKNRAGFCILHPIHETVGQEIEILNSKNETYKSNFPVLVSPENPFKDTKAMRWNCAGQWYSLEFEGDTFETEDQRNWTDASFKTFCTPLDLPFPVALKKGAKIHQQITFKPESVVAASTTSEKITISLEGKKIILPFLGVLASKELLSKESTILLKSIPISFYSLDVTPSSEGWVNKFSDDCVNAQALEIPLSISLHLSRNYKDEIDAFVMICLQNRLQITRVLLLSDGALATEQHVIEYGTTIRENLPGVKIGGGTKYNFTELNRNRFNADKLDFISFSIHPQEHAFDNLSIIETLEAQLAVATSAKAIYPGKEIHILPVTLRKRFNPYATTASGKIIDTDQQKDPRQSSPFCASWTLGSIKHLAQAEVSCITYYECVGELGILSDKGDPYPVYEALKKLRTTQELIAPRSSHPLKVDALYLSNHKMLIWNYTDLKQEVNFGDQTLELAPLEVLTKII